MDCKDCIHNEVCYIMMKIENVITPSTEQWEARR